MDEAEILRFAVYAPCVTVLSNERGVQTKKNSYTHSDHLEQERKNLVSIKTAINDKRSSPSGRARPIILS
jgi:hypothetical protein